MVVFDVVQRWLRASGYQVTYVRNITDIDDKIIRRAAENGEPIGELTERFIGYMDEDAAALGVQKPDHEPRATEYIPQMLAMIGELESNGLAYRVPSGDVNYRGAEVSRLRQALREVARRAARRRARRDRPREAGSARLRAVEAFARPTSPPGSRRSATAGRAGTSSARP